MRIEATEIKLVKVSDLKHYKMNRNKHPKDQVERLAKLIKEHGMRDPLTVDVKTMEVITGNGTLMACKLLKMDEVPVIFQEFASDEQRYAFSVSHNAINQWSEIDLAAIHVDLPQLGPFDLDNLAIKNFKFEPLLDPQEQTPELKLIECPDCGHQFESKQAKSKKI